MDHYKTKENKLHLHWKGKRQTTRDHHTVLCKTRATTLKEISISHTWHGLEPNQLLHRRKCISRDMREVNFSVKWTLKKIKLRSMLLGKSKQQSQVFFPHDHKYYSLSSVTSPIYVTMKHNMNYTSIPYNIMLLVMIPLALQAKHRSYLY